MHTHPHKAALVTGAGTRLGRAMAEHLGQQGWAVAVHYARSERGASETVATIQGSGGTAISLKADLHQDSETQTLISRAAKALGHPITLLVNSASLFIEDDARGHMRKEWDAHMQVNLRAPILLSQSLANALPDKTKALIINLIDQRVWKLNPQFFTYTLSKSALWSATRTLAQALSPYIRVNAIGPGPTLKSIHQSQEEFDAEQAATLTGEGSSPQEIIAALDYLIVASSVTGQMIASDGGQHLLWQTPDIVL